MCTSYHYAEVFPPGHCLFRFILSFYHPAPHTPRTTAWGSNDRTLTVPIRASIAGLVRAIDQWPDNTT
jgi:hypothetical protein